MSFGLAAFTLLHVVLSLAGIATGFVVVFGLITAKRLNGWTMLFLAATLATSVTGFLFPVHKFLPSHAVGIVSLGVLAMAICALYYGRLVGAWRPTYVVTAVIALDLNVFVLIAQLFAKVPALKAMVPTQSEAPFKIAQLSLLVLFAVPGIVAVKRFRQEQVRPA
jgi:hypothetical protein